MAKRKIKAWYTSKTVAMATATILSGLATYITGERSLEELTLVIIGAVFMVLRFVTDKPVK